MANGNCTGAAELPEYSNLNIPAHTSYFVAAGQNISAAMTDCCQPSIVHREPYPNCYQWCEIPESLLQNKPTEKDLQVTFGNCFFRNHTGRAIFGVKLSSAEKRSPSLFGLTTLCLVLSAGLF